MTNDDGLNPANSLLTDFAASLYRKNWMRDVRIVIVAPGGDESACGMRISLGDRGLKVKRRRDVERQVLGQYTTVEIEQETLDGPLQDECNMENRGSDQVYVYEILRGSPADCVIFALDENGLLARLNVKAKMLISALNVGSNMGSDILYSGTFAAARQAAMYGLPSIAASSVGNIEDGQKVGVLATEEIVEKLYRGFDEDDQSKSTFRKAWENGRIIPNLNVPAKWNGTFAATRPGRVWYREVVHLDGFDPKEEAEKEIKGMSLSIKGGRADYHGEEGSDFCAIDRRQASVSTLQSWPCTHPLALPDDMLLAELPRSISNGLPKWIASARCTERVVSAASSQNGA